MDGLHDVGVVIPAYNEEKYLRETLKALKKIEMIRDILVVDDGSEDQTAEIAREEEVRLIKLPKNQGKGYALRRGLKELENRIILFLDADLGESAKEAQKLITPLIRGEADVTIARFPYAAGAGGFGLVKKLARMGIRFLTGRDLSSILSGQRGFKRQVLRQEFLLYPRFGIEFGMTIDLMKSGAVIKEVDVKMHHRLTGKDLAGFKHRASQFADISRVFLKKWIFEKRGPIHDTV